MGLKSDGKTPLEAFRPKDVIPRSELVTTISRMLYGNKYDNNQWIWRWVDHMEKLASDWIVTVKTPTLIEPRGYVILMLHRLQ